MHVRAALLDAGLGALPPLAIEASRGAGGLAGASWLLSSWSKMALFAAALIGGGTLAVMLLRPSAAPSPASSPTATTAPERAAPPLPEEPTDLGRRVDDEPPPAPAHSSPKTRPTATAVAKPARVALDDAALERELRIVASADAAIRAHHFTEALRVLSANDSGASVLQEERMALRILAWCGQGADEHALHARERFLQASPQAVLATRVRDACGPSVESAR